MATLSVKNVPEEVVDRLRKRAERNHRSMQGELMALICQAVEADTGTTPALQRRADGDTPIERIASEHRARWKQPFPHAPRAVEMIRGDRDAH